VRRVASAAVVEVNELRDDLVGKSGAQVSMAFVMLCDLSPDGR